MRDYAPKQWLAESLPISRRFDRYDVIIFAICSLLLIGIPFLPLHAIQD